MTRPGSSATVVMRPDLRAGPLLAEGGEGRVYELADRPGLLYKAYRRPVPRAPLAALVAWEDRLAVDHPEVARRVWAATAWPDAVVTEPGAPDGTVAGILLPRAPRRFSLRHRDGTSRLATLSYLTADPGQRAAAYGLALPGAGSAERVGIVYALARVLEAFQSADPAIGHGDLSTKNVLWSLERGPEVFLLDCDSCELYGESGAVVDDDGGRARAMTPNWDDPAIAPGANPTLASDRYSLALVFLRVVGAAHFPLQRRQREGEVLGVELGLPSGTRQPRSLREGAVVWDLCAQCLSTVDPARRPGAAVWVAALEEILDEMGAMGQVRAVWAAQGGGVPAPTPRVAPTWVPDVTVRPVPVATGTRRYRTLSPAASRPPGTPGAPGPPAAPRPVTPAWGASGPGRVAASRAAAAAAGPGTPPPPGLFELAATGSRKGAEIWLAVHRRTLAAVSTRGRRREGAGRVVGCILVDFALMAVIFYVVAMVVSALLGI